MQEIIRDRLWIFTCVAGSDNDSLTAGGISTPSRMTPAEGAFYLGVPNLIMVRWRGLPAWPFDQYAVPFRPLKRLSWSVVGSGGRQDEGDDVGQVLAFAERTPNVTGLFFDDFFVSGGGGKHTGVLSPDELAAVREQLSACGQDLEMWVTFYSRALDPAHPSHFEIESPAEFLQHFDVITLWTRGGDSLTRLEQHVEALERLCPGPRVAIGCDFWDFANKAMVPIPLMEMQCELCLKWLKEGRISDMIFLANTVMDVGLEVVDWTREWIQAVGDEPLMPGI